MDISYKKVQVTTTEAQLRVDLETGTDAKNWRFIMSRLTEMVPAERQEFDDAYLVRVEGDELVFYWPTDTKVENLKGS